MKNNKAFTLVELLAVIIIIGILSSIGTVAITSTISNSKKDAYIEQAKKYIDIARNNITMGNYGVKKHCIDNSCSNTPSSSTKCSTPPKGKLTIIPLSIINSKNENKKSPYNGIINSGYVFIYNTGNNNLYYISLIDTKSNSIGLNAPIEETKLSRKDVLKNTPSNDRKTWNDLSANFTKNDEYQISLPISGNTTQTIYEVCK